MGTLVGASLALIVFMAVYIKYDMHRIRTSTNFPMYFQNKAVNDCSQGLPGPISNDIRAMCIDSIRQMSKEYVVQHVISKTGWVTDELILRSEYEAQRDAENKALDEANASREQAMQSYDSSMSFQSVTSETESGKLELNAQRDALVTQAEKKGWKLIVGDPTNTCTRPTFEGEVTVHGWYVWDTFYVEKEWMLYISDEDSDKLPFDKSFLGYGKDDQLKLRLDDASKERERNLIRASKEHPREVVIRQYSLYCEGSPTVRINKQAK